jgi:coenzyme F420-reducing hydrogenase delta subunit
MRCVDCESHAIVNGKLDCNYMGRLGLSQPTVKTFMESALTPEKVEAQMKDLEEQIKKMEEEKKKLEELKARGEKSGSLS